MTHHTGSDEGLPMRNPDRIETIRRCPTCGGSLRSDGHCPVDVGMERAEND